ncbi:MAG: hypothetical protein ACE5EL_03125 [Anaerolineae bacterium]
MGPVRVAHPHMSMVFLAGDYAYKIRKPRALGFLDFTALAARRHFCNEEVRLNRRLAPGVCLGAVSVVEEAGALRIVLDPDAPGAVE